MRRLLYCLILLQALQAVGQQETNTFPNFTDVLLLKEGEELNIYIENARAETLDALQLGLDELPVQKKREGVLMRFDPRTVPLPTVLETALSVYRCGIPVIYLYDITVQYSESQISASPYLFALHRMPKYNRFLRVLDIGTFLLLPTITHRESQHTLPRRSGALLGSLAVIVLAAASYIAGLYLSRIKGPWWTLGYIVPLVLSGIIASARWMPALEMKLPFRLLMAERREYIVMAAATALLLAVPAARLKMRTTAVLTTSFAALFVLHFSLLPFLLPFFNRTELLGLRNSFDRYGVCLQNTGYTCGPAAAVSALREFDISSDEGEIAVFAHSTSSAGTPPELLCRAINALYAGRGIDCEFRSFQKVQDLRGYLPVIAVVKFGFLVDHYVTVLRVTDEHVTLADPSSGMRIVSAGNFENEWRRNGIVVTRTAPEDHGLDGEGSAPAE